MSSHVPRQTKKNSASIPLLQPQPPTWLHLNSTVQQALMSTLTRMLLPHLPEPQPKNPPGQANPRAAKEVRDEAR
jgi:Leucine-rich repeat (LRR) protein